MMLALTFPAGLLSLALIAAINYGIHHFVDQGANSYVYTELLIVWCVLFATGYLQWFKLLPWLIGKIVRRNSLA